MRIIGEGVAHVGQRIPGEISVGVQHKHDLGVNPFNRCIERLRLSAMREPQPVQRRVSRAAGAGLSDGSQRETVLSGQHAGGVVRGAVIGDENNIRWIGLREKCRQRMGQVDRFIVRGDQDAEPRPWKAVHGRRHWLE